MGLDLTQKMTRDDWFKLDWIDKWRYTINHMDEENPFIVEESEQK